MAPDSLVCRSPLECSAGLQTATRDLLRTFTRAAGRPRARRDAVLRPARFGSQHIPAFLPETWSSRHFGHIEGVNPIFLRRTAALRLVQMVAGGSLAEAASLLGIADPDRTWQGRIYSGAGHVHSHAKDQPDPRGFENGLRTLAAELDTSAHLVDYQDRRQRLCDWSLDPMAWQELITRLPPTPGPVQPELGDRKRQCASIYVWVRLTLKGGIYH